MSTKSPSAPDSPRGSISSGFMNRFRLALFFEGFHPTPFDPASVNCTNAAADPTGTLPALADFYSMK